MLATLRQKYWILGGRAPVKSFIHQCIRCTRQLPPTRVIPLRLFS